MINTTNIPQKTTDDKTKTCYYCGHTGIIGDDITEVVAFNDEYAWACQDTLACESRRAEQLEGEI